MKNQNLHTMKIRKARLDDLSTIKTLYNQLTTDSANVEKDFPIILNDPNSLCFILEEPPIGMAMCYVRRHYLLEQKWSLMKSLLTTSIGAEGMVMPLWSTVLPQQKK